MVVPGSVGPSTIAPQPTAAQQPAAATARRDSTGNSEEVVVEDNEIGTHDLDSLVKQLEARSDSEEEESDEEGGAYSFVA